MRRLLVVTMILFVAACASSRPGASARSDRTLLTIEEINSSGATDAFTAVSALRPNWLSTRGASSFRGSESVKVYLDGNLMGGPEVLRTITTNSIKSIRRLDGLQAGQRFGLDHGSGAILLFTRLNDR